LVDLKFDNNFFPYKTTNEMLPIAFKKFLANRLLKKSGVESYTYSYKKFIEICGVKSLNQYTRADGINFIKTMRNDGKKLSENTVASYTKQMHIIWEWFIGENLAKENIIKTVPRKRTQIKIIPDADLKIIFEYFRTRNPQHYYFVRFTYLTGFRPSTTLALKTDDIKIDERVIIYPNIKENKESLFPIHNTLLTLIMQMDLQPGKKLFHWTDRKNIFFARAMRALGFKYSLKLLRKNLGTLAANNIGLFAAQTMLDHENSSTTELSYSRRPLMEQLRMDINEKINFLN
jgi:integrase